MRSLLAGLAVLCFAAAAHAQTPAAVEAVERARAIGAELYAHDQAAWHGTDAMLADISNPGAEGFRGWVTERTPDGIVLLFVRPEGEALNAAYRALYRDGEVREHGRVNQPLTEQQARLFRARQIGVAAIAGQPTCAPTYNTVALPREVRGEDGADIDVYLMPAFQSMQRIPFGGHYRVAVDSEAGVALSTSNFTTRCFDMDIEPNTAAVMISQVIGDYPTEIHFFLSATANVHIGVVSHSGTWMVEDGVARYLAETHN